MIRPVALVMIFWALAFMTITVIIVASAIIATHLAGSTCKWVPILCQHGQPDPH